MGNFKLTLLILIAPLFIKAQTLAQIESNTLTASFKSTTNYFSTKNGNNPNESAEAARKQVRSTLNLMRGYAISVEAASETNEETTQENKNASFGEYLSKMEQVLKNRIKNLETGASAQTNQATDISETYRALNLLKSAQCLADKKEGNFVRQKDLDGIEIVAFNLESLKSNARYGLIEAYKDGFARIKKDQVFGYLNYCGDEVVACQYEIAEPFNNGRALVKKVNWHFIDADGNESEVLKNVNKAQAIKHGISLVKLSSGKMAFINNKYDQTKKFASEEFDEITPLNSAMDVFKIKVGNKVGMMDLYGNIKLSPLYDEIEPSTVAHLYRINQNGKMGLVDNKMKVIVEPKYISIGEFNDFGLAPVCQQEKKYGFINANGTEVIVPIYEEIESFNKHGLVVVRELTKECNKNKSCKTDIVYNKYGQVIIAKPMESEVSTMKIRYQILDTLHCDKYIAVRKIEDEESKGFMLIDVKNFKLLNSKPYTSVTPLDINGMIRVKDANLWGIMDGEGNIMVEPIYTEIRKSSDGLYAAKNDSEKYGFIDKKGKIVVPFEYEDVKSFRNGYCIVAKGKEKWGLINKFSAKIVPCVFKSVAVKEGGYEMTDSKDDVFKINDKGDCMENCSKFEEIRKKANQ